MRSLALALLRRDKGEDTGEEEQSKRTGGSPAGINPNSSVHQLGVIKARPSWLQNEIREGELFKSDLLENKCMNSCCPDNNCELRKLQHY